MPDERSHQGCGVDQPASDTRRDAHLPGSRELATGETQRAHICKACERRRRSGRHDRLHGASGRGRLDEAGSEIDRCRSLIRIDDLRQLIENDT
jgi:hypothetical protein